MRLLHSACDVGEVSQPGDPMDRMTVLVETPGGGGRVLKTVLGGAEGDDLAGVSPGLQD